MHFNTRVYIRPMGEKNRCSCRGELDRGCDLNYKTVWNTIILVYRYKGDFNISRSLHIMSSRNFAIMHYNLASIQLDLYGIIIIIISIQVVMYL